MNFSARRNASPAFAARRPRVHRPTLAGFRRWARWATTASDGTSRKLRRNGGGAHASVQKFPQALEARVQAHAGSVPLTVAARDPGQNHLTQDGERRQLGHRATPAKARLVVCLARPSTARADVGAWGGAQRLAAPAEAVFQEAAAPRAPAVQAPAAAKIAPDASQLQSAV